MEKREIKVAAVQMETMPGKTRKERLNRALSLIERASKEGCRIIALGELCTVDYDMLYKLDNTAYDLAETIPGPTTEAVGEVTKKYSNYVIMPIFEKKIPGIYYNSAPVIGPKGEIVGNYRKTHLASARVLERMYFRSGQEFFVFETEFFPHARFGITICFDRRHPESSRILAVMGAEIMFCPTAAMEYAGGTAQWDIVNICRSVDSGMYTIYPNRVGRETEHYYFGDSMIVSPKGEVVERSKVKTEDIIEATLDLDEVEKARIAHPILREMRMDLYERYYSLHGNKLV